MQNKDKFISGIPLYQITHTASRSSKDYEVEFVNTEVNNDTYVLKLYLRFIDNKYRIRLVIISSILAYPALDLTWVFPQDQYDLAARTFHRICNEAEDIKTHSDKETIPVATLAAAVRESVKPIATNYQEKRDILPIDESKRESGVSDWRVSLYGNRFPKLSKEIGTKEVKYQGNQHEPEIKRRQHRGRSRR